MPERREPLHFWPFLYKFPSGSFITPDQTIMLALTVFALFLPFLLTPEPSSVGTHTQLHLPPCTIFRLTGLPCPTCGMTTSFAWLVRGRFGPAFLAHPAGIAAYLYLFVNLAILAWATLRRRPVNIVWRASLLQVLLTTGLIWAVKLAAWFLTEI